MENQKQRLTDNGWRKHIPNPGWIIALALISGMIVKLVLSVTSVPELSKKVMNNIRRLDRIEVKLDFIKDGIKEIKDLIKDK